MRSLVAIALTASVALTGCGGGESEAEKVAEKQLRAAVRPPRCAWTRPEVQVPAAFPKEFPLPEGSKVYATEERSGGRTIVYAVVDVT